MDAALRTAERAYASVCPAGAGVTWSMIEAARDELNRQRQRAGLAPLCNDCDEPTAEREPQDQETYRCAPCWRHVVSESHYMHDEFVDDCPRCASERETPGEARCEDCGRTTIVYPGSEPLASGNELLDTCGHCQHATTLTIL